MRPVAAHRWEEKFKGQTIPRNALLERVELLRKAQDEAKKKDQSPLDWWQREINWRLRQLGEQSSKRIVKREDNGDTESSEPVLDSREREGDYGEAGDEYGPV